MNRTRRRQLLYAIAQDVSPPGAPVQPSSGNSSTTSTNNSTATQVSATIDINVLPGYRPTLFDARPDIIIDLTGIINIVNSYLIKLSNGQVDFNIVWKNPSVSGSEYTNGVKNLVNLAKWLYSVVKTTTGSYTIQGLIQIAQGLVATVQSYSFPEPGASDLNNKLVSAGQTMLVKLGGQ